MLTVSVLLLSRSRDQTPKGKGKMRVAKVRVGSLRVEVQAKHAST